MWGRGAYVLLFNAQGLLYVTRRSASKDVYPGLLDVVTSGVVAAGESYEATAARELGEEVGVAGAALSGLSRLFVFRWTDASCRVWGAAFSARCDAAAVRHADGEVASGEWLPLHEVAAHAAAAPAAFTPVGLYVLAAYQQQLRAAARRAGDTADARLVVCRRTGGRAC